MALKFVTLNRVAVFARLRLNSDGLLERAVDVEFAEGIGLALHA
jgi:hypothetical protein